MNNLIDFFNDRSKREKRLIVLLFTFFLVFILGSFINGIISKTSMASKKYQSAKNDYEYVRNSTLMIINSSKEITLDKDLSSIDAILLESALSAEIDYKYSKKSSSDLTIVFSTMDLLKAGKFLQDSSQILNANIQTILLETEGNERIIQATFKLLD